MNIGIVIFTDFPNGSAPARRVHMIGKGLAALGHELHILVPQRFSPGPLDQEIDGLHVHWGAIANADNWNQPARRLSARIAAWRRLQQLASCGLDWLLLSNPSLDGIPFIGIARRHGTRVMAMYDDLRAHPSRLTIEDRVRLFWQEAADKLIPRLTQLNLTISSYLEQRVHALAPHTPTMILPPLVDPDLFQCQSSDAAAFRTQWGLENTTIISYLGTYWNVDGVSVLLRTAAQLAQAGEQFKLVLSGAAHQGLECDDVPRLVEELSLQNVVVQTGWLPVNQVVAGMSAADVLVLPKLDHIANVAGVPTKLAEYLAIGRPVVASSVGDIPLYLKNHENALLCKPGSTQSLAGELRRLIVDPQLRGQLARNARPSAYEHFDYRKITRNLENALHAATR